MEGQTGFANRQMNRQMNEQRHCIGDCRVDFVTEGIILDKLKFWNKKMTLKNFSRFLKLKAIMFSDGWQ